MIQGYPHFKNPPLLSLPSGRMAPALRLGPTSDLGVLDSKEGTASWEKEHGNIICKWWIYVDTCGFMTFMEISARMSWE